VSIEPLVVQPSAFKPILAKRTHAAPPLEGETLTTHTLSTEGQGCQRAETREVMEEIHLRDNDPTRIVRVGRDIPEEVM